MTYPDYGKGVTFAIEKLADVLQEPGVKELVHLHYQEIAEDQAELPFKPDWNWFIRAEEAGSLLLYVARNDGGMLVGYQIFYLMADPSTRTMGAFDGPFFLDPDYRQGDTGSKLLFGLDDELKKRGVKRVIRHLKLSTYEGRGGLLPLFERAGYRPYEIRLSKILGAR